MAASRRHLTIGTRGSQLALWQSNRIKESLEMIAGVSVGLKVIKTTGDKILDVPLAKIGGKGLFTKELEVELLAGTVDLCVHSMKDVPTELPEGCVIAATPERADPRDVLVCGPVALDVETLPRGAKVGTSSLRRRSQIVAARPDLEIVDVRGNLDTRMRKAEEGRVDAVILAAAGIVRLGWADRIAYFIPPNVMVPAVGQGAIAVEIRADDEYMAEVCQRLNHTETLACVKAERVVMRSLEGGCQVPVGAYARVEGDALVMDGLVGSLDGSHIVRDRVTGHLGDPEGLGHALVERLRSLGADGILAEIRGASDVGALLQS